MSSIQNCSYQPGELMLHAINLAGAVAEVTESSVSHSAPLDGSDWKRQPVPFGNGNVEIYAMESSYSTSSLIRYFSIKPPLTRLRCLFLRLRK